jgi:glutathione synthase/RimK-type ligase-like ATP-grasp enzyme
MLAVDVLMPDAASPYLDMAPQFLAPYRPAFAERGIELRPRPWDAGPGNSDATLALFAWGYHLNVARWQAILADWPADRPLFNAPRLLAWNTHKTYLRDLDAAGIPIVPSIFGHADAQSVAAAFAAFGCDELVVKPQVSGGSHKTVRLKRHDTVEPLDDAIIQPFLPAVGEEGELSFLTIGGTFSHAVRKVAAPGDFRIQPQFGGVFSRFKPEAEQLALVDRVLAQLPAPTLYARVDLIRLPDGNLALMELEAIEPDLYVAQEPETPARLAEAFITSMQKVELAAS